MRLDIHTGLVVSAGGFFKFYRVFVVMSWCLLAICPFLSTQVPHPHSARRRSPTFVL